MLKDIAAIVFTPAFAFSVLRIATPVLFAALGGIFASRAGIFNMALEGMMLISALTGVVVSAKVKMGILGGLKFGMDGYAEIIGKAEGMGALAGFLAGVLAAVLVGLFMAFMGIKLRANMYLTGLALNTIASGGTVFVLYLAAGEKGVSLSLASSTMPIINIPIIKDIPVIGQIISGHNIMVYLAIISIFIVYILIDKTAMGLRIRAVGENPNAAESVGIDVQKVQFQALALSGLFAGFGGVSLSMGYVSFFSRGMTAGRGFMALSAMNVGRAQPLGTAVAALIFGVFDSASNALQCLSIPTQFASALPYVATLVALVVFAIQSERKLKKIKSQEK